MSGKAGISRSLPNDEYDGAVNANNPSATNPFLTEDDLSTGLKGSVNIPVALVLESGNATSGVTLDSNQITYEIVGGGGAVLPRTKTAYFQFVVPAGYSSGADFTFVLATNQAITTFSAIARINGTTDPTFGNQNLNTVAFYPTFENQTYTLGALAPGDIVTLRVSFAGQNGMDVWIRGLEFNYNIDIL